MVLTQQHKEVPMGRTKLMEKPDHTIGLEFSTAKLRA